MASISSKKNDACLLCTGHLKQLELPHRQTYNQYLRDDSDETLSRAAFAGNTAFKLPPDKEDDDLLMTKCKID